MFIIDHFLIFLKIKCSIDIEVDIKVLLTVFAFISSSLEDNFIKETSSFLV